MGKRRAVLLIVLVMMWCAVAMVSGYEDEGEEGWRERKEGDERGGRREAEEEEEERERERGGEDLFMLQDVKQVVRTDAGDMKLVRGGGIGGGGGWMVERAMHVGFITMEPKSLFIPRYLDSNLIIFVRRGDAKVGSIYKDDFVEKRLKSGDVYRIAAGSAFYLVNIGEGQRLHIICSLDKAESLGWGTVQSFYIGGGTNPQSILAGFDPLTLSTAFNVSTSELREIMTSQKSGPIVYLSDSHSPSTWSQFLQLKTHERQHHLKKMMYFQEQATKEEEEETWSLRKFLNSVFRTESNGEDNKGPKSPDSYNLFDRKPDFENRYGSSMAIDESDYSPLRHSGIGLYLVNLTAGSMMAPHVNPSATEYGVVLRGTGTIQVVFPNGTSAMNAKVSEGDVFWIPRYFPFCQIASRTDPFEFFGFSTSSQKNRPQFLVGANSIMKSMRSPAFAASFGLTEEQFSKLIDAQHEGVILPSASAAPPDMQMRVEDKEVTKAEEMPRVIRSFDNKMIMGFD
ncbi:hypothetical protein HYC85_031822 [Camellia sinensis]|uniref:Cupin type-1 domain-containing protein n=1 Tax=Camellia sinensis TaxID=4442 RepID=A0A7J7FRS2_CAMSI|nr:hypothetical protein HYC85_031822 [Camellia sinensis]